MLDLTASRRSSAQMTMLSTSTSIYTFPRRCASQPSPPAPFAFHLRPLRAEIIHGAMLQQIAVDEVLRKAGGKPRLKYMTHVSASSWHALQAALLSMIMPCTCPSSVPETCGFAGAVLANFFIPRLPSWARLPLPHANLEGG